MSSRSFQSTGFRASRNTACLPPPHVCWSRRIVYRRMPKSSSFMDALIRRMRSRVSGASLYLGISAGTNVSSRRFGWRSFGAELSIFRWVNKTSRPPFGFWWRHQLSQSFDQAGNGLVMRVQLVLHALFQFLQPLRQFFVGRNQLAQTYKSTHHVDTHFHRLRRVQYIGCLNGTMLREGKRQGSGKLELMEVVTICDHLPLLGFSKLEHEVFRKAGGVAFDCLV